MSAENSPESNNGEETTPRRKTSFADYHLVIDEPNSNNNRQEASFMSPNSTFREEVGLHNDGSNRFYFDEETTTLPSREEINNLEPLLYVPQREPSPLNRINYLNAVTYAAHLFVSWGIGVWGIDGIVDTRWEILKQYETLVTPALWAQYLWAPILILEGLFVIAQLLPRYRNLPIVQEGTGYFFFYCFLLQTAWTLFFSFQLFTFSFISVVLALICLISLLLTQIHTISNDERRSWLEYMLFRFPFFLHTGWMVLMTTDHFALLFRAFGTSAHMQAAIDILSLALLLAAGVACLIRPPYSDFVIPAVIVWCFLGIATRLEEPSEKMLEMYGNTLVLAIRDCSFILAGVLSCCLAPCIVVWLFRECCTIRVVELEE
mmetsp:Transcript_4254/g.9440  ORF Transcript_4254/g.9440 Transcript_4254/m.9440 type:complete len:376 (-) Transcript_4254:94-1221(-)